MYWVGPQKPWCHNNHYGFVTTVLRAALDQACFTPELVKFAGISRPNFGVGIPTTPEQCSRASAEAKKHQEQKNHRKQSFGQQRFGDERRKHIWTGFLWTSLYCFCWINKSEVSGTMEGSPKKFLECLKPVHVFLVCVCVRVHGGQFTLIARWKLACKTLRESCNARLSLMCRTFVPWDH